MATDSAGHDFLSARQIFTDALSLSRLQINVEPIKTAALSVSGSETECKLALDQAFRDGIKDLVINNGGCPDYIGVINLSIDAVHHGLCSPTTPFLLLSDVFDAVTIRDSDEVFKFVEEKVGTWKASEFYTAGKNYLLRMCNDLLRRLSKSQDTVFCGRIQLFLARFFPLDEKSGLNLMSQFHLDNVTSFNTEQKEGSLKIQDKDASMDYEDGETGHSATPVDYTLYRKFWAIQDFFRNPTQCFIKEKWRLFLRNTKAVLEAFTSLKLDDVSASKNKEPSTREDTRTIFAKFLTSEKLYDLQLSDPTFRRYILVQYLILFQYLNQPVKFKQSQHLLTDEMTVFVKDTQEKVYTLLKETPPNGKEFCKSIQHCLSREEHWNAWKNEGCPSYVKEKASVEPSPLKAVSSRKRSLGEEMEIENQAGKKKIDMGNHELTRLWNICQDNMDACRSQERLFQPNMEAFFTIAKEESDPDACIEDEYKHVNNSNYAWKALRLMARRSPYFFQTVTNTGPPIKTIPAYLELMVSKLTKDTLQTTTTTEELKTEEENVENDELLKGGDESLEKVIILQSEQLDAIVPKLGADWKTLSSELGFTEEEVASIEDEQSEIKEQGRAMLMKWKDREGDQATQETLAKALQESGLKDIVESVLEATNGS